MNFTGPPRWTEPPILNILWKVMIPICRPTLDHHNHFKESSNAGIPTHGPGWSPMIPAYFLVSNGIQEIRENGFGRENIPAMMAAVVVISVPLILLLFLVFRKKIMEGVSRGGMKG